MLGLTNAVDQLITPSSVHWYWRVLRREEYGHVFQRAFDLEDKRRRSRSLKWLTETNERGVEEGRCALMLVKLTLIRLQGCFVSGYNVGMNPVTKLVCFGYMNPV